jgi:hypothetical protein
VQRGLVDAALRLLEQELISRAKCLELIWFFACALDAHEGDLPDAPWDELVWAEFGPEDVYVPEMDT